MVVLSRGSEVDRVAWEPELCLSAAAEFHVVVAYMERKVLEAVLDLMVVAHGGFWVAMLVGVTLDGCGVEEGEGCDRHDDSVMVEAVPGGSVADVMTTTAAMVSAGEHNGD